jgi:phage I-like protein
MDGWVFETLKSSGLAGVFIFVLIGANAAQWLAAKAKDRTLKALHEQRSIERETLVKLLERANAAQATTAAVTSERNEVIDRLSGAIMSQANSNERLGDRVANQTETTREKLGDIRHVIEATGESYRVLNGLVAEIRNALVILGGKVDAVAVDVKAGNRA